VTSRPWGFSLAEVSCEVQVWHGMADAFVPADHALHLVAGLPHCRAWFDPGEGHFFFRRRVREILAQLAGPVSAEDWNSRRADLGPRGRLRT
jgi:pimeloyl-ACP methyl ester carboxylesterase